MSGGADIDMYGMVGGALHGNPDEKPSLSLPTTGKLR